MNKHEESGKGPRHGGANHVIQELPKLGLATGQGFPEPVGGPPRSGENSPPPLGNGAGAGEYSPVPNPPHCHPYTY